MCGIAGIFNLNGEPVSRKLVRRMTDTLTHRGPDGEGHYTDQFIGLGHRRLAVLDLSDAGRQPMLSSDGNIVVSYNGEIYNFRELRKELEIKGHEFTSNTDTEVLIHGYEEEGIDFVERLNGMFAFVLWDKRLRTLYLVRDRYGIKPLYFWKDEKTLLFASEIKAMLVHPRVHVELNCNALNEYFTFQNLFRYQTLFKGIKLLPAACIYRIREGENDFHRRTYWDYDFTSRSERMSEAEAEEETVRLFRQAVTRQLVSDVPIGSYLSGGMDSGSIVAIASRYFPRLSTFTCGFHMHDVSGVESLYDERRDSELMANAFRTEHYELVMSSSDIAWSMPRLIYHLEDLRVGMSYPHYYISRLASKFVKVCLSGGGGDELYAGYPWRYYRVFRSLDKKDFFQQYYSFWQRLVGDEDKPSFFNPSIWRQVEDRDTFTTFSRVFTFNNQLNYATAEDHIANSLYFEIKTFLAGLFIVGDRLSMTHGLEERFPFMDNDLVDFAQRIPIRHKLRNLAEMKKIDENEVRKLQRYYREYDDGKNVLRRAMSRFIPEEIIHRKKQGFSSPDESWFRGGSLEYVRVLLFGPKSVYHEFLNPDYVKRIVDDHTEGKQNYRLLIWSFLCFEWWCRIFLQKQNPDENSPIPFQVY